MNDEKVKLHVDAAQMSKEEMAKMALNHSYWEENAEKYDSSNQVSWGDRNAMNLEVKNISDYIRDGMLVLDAGCSNGFSTFKISGNKNIKVKAFDFSKQAIEIAQKEQLLADSKRKITFSCGNILDIKEPSEKFDIAYTIRVMINLPSWGIQKRAIVEVHRTLKHGGLYLMSEAFWGSLEKLNSLRKLAGMRALTVPEFNLYLKEDAVEKFVKPYYDIVSVRKFSSIYYVASRFLRYLTMEQGSKDSYDDEINNIFAQYVETTNSGDFGIQKLYVLKKR